MSEFTLKLHHFIKNQFPEHIRSEHPALVDFLEAYYRFIDQENRPSSLLLNSANWTDIDLTLAEFVPLFRQQYATDIPTSALLNARRVVKYINEYYEAKGSENATKMFFRMMFNESANVIYPGDFILRASDGRWTTRRVIKVDASGFSEGDIYQLKNQTITLRYVEFIPNQGKLIRSVNTSCLNVTRQLEPNIYKLEVTLRPSYVFPELISEVTNIDIDGDGELETIESLGDYDTHVYVVFNRKVYGSLSKQIVSVQNIIDPGENFRIDDAYIIGQTGVEGRYFSLTGPDGYVSDIAGPYVFENFDNNAIIRVSRVTARPENGIDQIQLVATGQKFLARELNLLGDTSYFESPTNPVDNYVFNTLNPGAGADDYALDQTQLVPVNTFTVTLPPRAPRNITGESAQIVFRTGMVYDQPGTFKDSSGFLSDVNKLQDNYYYQPYSYVVQTQQQKSAWEDVFLKSNHPAGFKLFSVLQFIDNIDASAVVTDRFNRFGDESLIIEVLQGPTSVIAYRTITPSTAWTEESFEFTPLELSYITDPSALHVRIRKNNSDTILVSGISLELVGT